MPTMSQYELGTWEGSLITEGVSALSSPERRHLKTLFLIWTFFKSGQCALFLIMKEDVQCLFDRSQTGCFSQLKIQLMCKSV